MPVGRVAAVLGVVALVAVGCGDDGDAAPADSTTTSSTTSTTSTTSSTTTSTTSTSTTTTTTTEAPPPDCPTDQVLALVDSAIERARLAPGGGWSEDIVDSQFTERTATAAEFADRLALDCGLTATQSVGETERLVIAAWTGPRVAYLIQTTGEPSTPYRPDAIVTVLIEAPVGEFLDGEERALWAGTLTTGETFVIGHVDYVLGPVAKDWVAGPRVPFDEEIILDAERHGLASLEEAGMRNIGIAQPPEQFSEEGYVQFISPTGQIMVADVAPTGWFDPMLPRFFTGPSRVETIGAVDVRITEPAEGDNLGFTLGSEYAWACDEFVWIFEPPFNGDADEMFASAAAVIGTEECIAG
jgi:hypothetical protein